jgi:hypothetical protein
MTIPEQIKITLLCLFCGAPLEGPDDAEYSSGDLIKCNKCEELNDYDSVIEVAKEKGIKQMSEHVENHLKKELGKFFK